LSIKKLKVVWSYPAGFLQDRINGLLSDFCEVVAPKIGNEKELLTLTADAEILLVRRQPFKITRQLINAGKHLKLIQKIGTLCESIDLHACKEARIQVATMPMGVDIGVAEHAMTLMLALGKKLIQAHRATANGEYEALGLRPAPTTQLISAPNWMRLTGLQLSYGKTLGIIGLGEIGIEVAKRARAFGMKIVYYDIRKLSESQEEELRVQHCSLKELLRNADFVTLHLTHTKETENMIGREEFCQMKRTAFFINTSRGGVVDEEALYQALKGRMIQGAGLDVFKEEPMPKDSPLLKLENVILTPHIAYSESDIGVQGIFENVLRVSRGETALNII